MMILVFFFLFKQKTAYELRISDWSSDVCSSDLIVRRRGGFHIGILVAGTTGPRDHGTTGPRDHGKSVSHLSAKDAKNAKKRHKGKVPRTSRSGCRLQHR